MIDGMALRSQRKEIQTFIDMLRGADAREVALVLAMATEERRGFADSGFDILKYREVAHLQQDIPFKISSNIVQLQKMKRPSATPGLMVWLHSTRALLRPELRFLGRQMWAELQRGFQLVPEVADEIRSSTGIELRIDGYEQFPDGLEPMNEGEPHA